MNNHIRTFQINKTEDPFWINDNGKLTEENCSTLGMCKYSIIKNQFDNRLCIQQDNMLSTQEWSFVDVTKWVGTIKGRPHDICTALVRNDINGAIFFVMGLE